MRTLLFTQTIVVSLVAVSAPAMAKAQVLPSHSRAHFRVPTIGLFDRQAESQPATSASAPSSAELGDDNDADDEHESPGLPIAFSIEYTLVSDYITNGINYSEFPGEGREKPNHQVTTALEFDLAMLGGRERGEYGVVSFETFFEWYAAQAILNPDGGQQNLQEVDWTIGYSYEVKTIATMLRAYYTFYTIPNVSDASSTEVSFSIEHNDAWMWKWLLPENEDGVLNPSVYYAYDWDAARRGSWFEFGFSHDFELAENLTLTPALTLAADHGFTEGLSGLEPEARHMVLAYVQYGATISYDMTEAIGFDKWGYGSVVLSGFVYYNQVPQRVERMGLIDDEFWGGVTIGWSF